MARTLIQAQDICDTAVTNPKLIDLAVSTGKLQDSSVTTAKIAPSAVQEVNIAAGAVGTTEIQDFSVTSTKILNLALNNGNIIDGTITADKLDPGAYLGILEQKKITTFIEVDIFAVGAGLTQTEITGIIGLTNIPTSSFGIIEGIIVDEPKNYVAVRDSDTGEPVVAYNDIIGTTNDLFGRLTFGPTPGLTQWFLNFYVQPPGLTQFSTAIPNGTTQIDFQYMQRFNLGTVDESFSSSDKFFNGTVDVTEVLNINQLAKDVYTSPVLNNNGNALLGTPLQTQIQNIITGATPIIFNPAPHSIPGIAIAVNAITEGLMAAGSVGSDEIINGSITPNKIAGGSLVTSITTDGITNFFNAINLIGGTGIFLQDGLTSITIVSQIGVGGNVENVREDYVVGTPAGVYSGSTTFFNLLHVYVADGLTLEVYVDGVLMRLGATNDYLESSTTSVTFNNPLLVGQKVTFLFKISSPAGNAETVNGYQATNTPTANTLLPLDATAHVPLIAIPVITQAQLSTDSVGTTNIQSLAVTAAKIALATITESQLATLSVGTPELIANSVTQPKIASGAVGLTQLEDGSVTTAKIRDLNVTTAKLAATSVTMPKIANVAVGLTQLEDQSVTGSTANSGGSPGKVQQGTISTVDLRANAVTQIQRSTLAIGFGQGGTTNITTVTITTTGGPVLIVADAVYATSYSAGTGVGTRIYLFRDAGTDLISQEDSLPGNVGATWGLSYSYVDIPAAGTYTYKLNYSLTNSTILTVEEYHLTAVELKR